MSGGGEFKTLGVAANETGADFFALQRAARNVRPAFRLNGVAYYGAAAVRRIVAQATGGRRHASGRRRAS